jgi:hypothetical protein
MLKRRNNWCRGLSVQCVNPVEYNIPQGQQERRYKGQKEVVVESWVGDLRIE